MERVAEVRFSYIGYVEALQTMGLIPFDGPHVEDVLYILHGVDVAVHVYVAVVCLHVVYAVGSLSHLDTLERLDGALLRGFDILRD